MIKLKVLVPTVLIFALISTFTVVRSDRQRKEKEEKKITSRIEEINLENTIETVNDPEFDMDLTPKKR